MKTITIKRALLALCYLAWLNSPKISYSQQAVVWATVPDYTSLLLNKTALKNRLTTGNPDLQNVFENLPITSIEQALPAAISPKLQKVYEIKCNCEATELMRQLESKSTYFKKLENLGIAEPLYTPNDYSLAMPTDYALDLINAEGAWDITHGNISTVIAITDFNYFSYHEELMNKIDYITPDNFSSYPEHGTAVAIMAAGETDNNMGKSSIGFNSPLQLRPAYYNQILEASASGIRIVNVSWTNTCFYSTYAQAVLDEVYANGTIVVAAAGNGVTCYSATNLVFPAAHDHVFSVTSVGPWDNHERTIGDPNSTHQHNATVDLCAPGYDVAISPYPGTYLTGNGTSFAAPLVSGTIALMLAVNPCLTVDQIEFILKETAVNIDALNPAYVGMLGAGRLDAQAAVAMAVDFLSLPITGSVTSTCETTNQNIVLDLSAGTAPFAIEWNTGATTATIQNLAPGTYTALVTDHVGCNGIITIEVDTLEFMALNEDVTGVLCNNYFSPTNTGSVQLNVSGGHPGYTYVWSNDESTDAIFNLSEGIYSVVVTDSMGCSEAMSFAITFPTEMESSISSTPYTTNTYGTINLTVSGGTQPYTYYWVADGFGQTAQDLTNLLPGFYEVQIIDANGCLDAQYTYVYNLMEQYTGPNTVFDKPNGTKPGTSKPVETAIKDKSGKILTALGLEDIQIFPNPARNFTTVYFEGIALQTIVLTDLSGKILQNIPVAEDALQEELLVRTAGEYLVILIAKDGEKVVRKISFI
jgi:subtilisin family serine protease